MAEVKSQVSFDSSNARQTTLLPGWLEGMLLTMFVFFLLGFVGWVVVLSVPVEPTATNGGVCSNSTTDELVPDSAKVGGTLRVEKSTVVRSCEPRALPAWQLAVGFGLPILTLVPVIISRRGRVDIETQLLGTTVKFSMTGSEAISELAKQRSTDLSEKVGEFEKD